MPNQDEQELTLDRALWYGRMYRAHSASTEAEISPQFLRRLQKSQTKKSPIFLCLRKGGLIQAVSWEEDSALLGEFSTRSFLEYHNGGVESRLSQILQGGQLRKYYLSAKACQGILNRAKRRGKELPEMLRIALEQQAQSVFLNEPDAQGGGKGILIQDDQTGTLSTVQNQAVCYGFKGGQSDGGIGYQENTSPTLSATPSALEPTVVYPEVSRTLSARHDSSPCIDRGQEMICYPETFQTLTANNAGWRQRMPDKANLSVICVKDE